MNKLIAVLALGLFAAVSSAGAATLPHRAHSGHHAGAHAKAHAHKHVAKAHKAKSSRKVALRRSHKLSHNA